MSAASVTPYGTNRQCGEGPLSSREGMLNCTRTHLLLPALGAQGVAGFVVLLQGGGLLGRLGHVRVVQHTPLAQPLFNLHHLHVKMCGQGHRRQGSGS